MNLLDALKNFAEAVVNRNSTESIDKATADLHATLNPGAKTDAKVPQTTKLTPLKVK